jgi:hypothetical protein
MISKKVLSILFSGEPQEVCGSAAQKAHKKARDNTQAFSI